VISRLDQHVGESNDVASENKDIVARISDYVQGDRIKTKNAR